MPYRQRTSKHLHTKNSLDISPHRTVGTREGRGARFPPPSDFGRNKSKTFTFDLITILQTKFSDLPSALSQTISSAPNQNFFKTQPRYFDKQKVFKCSTTKPWRSRKDVYLTIFSKLFLVKEYRQKSYLNLDILTNKKFSNVVIFLKAILFLVRRR